MSGDGDPKFLYNFGVVKNPVRAFLVLCLVSWLSISETNTLVLVLSFFRKFLSCKTQTRCIMAISYSSEALFQAIANGAVNFNFNCAVFIVSSWTRPTFDMDGVKFLPITRFVWRRRLQNACPYSDR